MAHMRLSQIFPNEIAIGRAYPFGLRGMYVPLKASPQFEDIRSLHRMPCRITQSITLREVKAYKPLLKDHPHLTIARILLDVRAEVGSPHYYALVAALADKETNTLTLVYKDDDSERAQVIKEFLHAIIRVHAPLFVAEGLLPEFYETLDSCFSPSYLEENRMAVFDPTTQSFKSKLTDFIGNLHGKIIGDSRTFRTRAQDEDEYDNMSIAERSRCTGNPVSDNRRPPSHVYARSADDYSSIQSMAPSMSSQSKAGVASAITQLRSENALLVERLAAMEAILRQVQVSQPSALSQPTDMIIDDPSSEARTEGQGP